MLKIKNKIFLAPFAAACLLTLSACTADDQLPVHDSPMDKTSIELTVGIVGDNLHATRSVTRSVVTTDRPYAQDAKAFAENTSLYMVMKSDNEAGDKHRYTRTVGTVTGMAIGEENAVSFGDNSRFWEDADPDGGTARTTKLSVYSACVPGKATALSIGGSTTYSNNSWSTAAATTTIAWPMFSTSVADQSTDFMAAQDLCFSNNVSDLGTDNRVYFNEGRFISRKMIFYHALTWVTFRIKKGEGFEVGDAFAFTNANENIVLKGFNTSGTFDIINGEFKTSDPAIGTADITKMAVSTNVTIAATTYPYVLDCLMLPGSNLNDNTRDLIYFTIDNNLYHLTKKQLMDALGTEKLSDNTTPALEAVSDERRMRPGVHYIFTLTVGKKKMDNLTAAVVPWETASADETTPSNARISVTLLDNGTKKAGTADFDLYRKSSGSPTIDDDFENYNWATGYVGNKATLTGTGTYVATGWYWPDNKTFYHFRAVQPVDHAVTTDGEDGDYLTLNRAASYTDVCWGAPFYALDVDHLSTPLHDTKLTYSLTTGFDNEQDHGEPTESHQISKAIGATSDPINMEMFHAMSDVTIQLTTPQSGDADYDARVSLSGATIKLTNTYPTGKVLMGNGLVTPTGDVSDVNATVNASYKVEHYGFVPQSLADVVLTITTTDHNQYVVDMKDVLATTVGNNLIANPYTANGSGKYPIDYWYPNYKYTYTFKLKKTGVELITATLADWEAVTAGNDDVRIK